MEHYRGSRVDPWQGKLAEPMMTRQCQRKKKGSNGAPERIRTSDPQIRSLGNPPEIKPVSRKPAEIAPVSNQQVTEVLQTNLKHVSTALRMRRAADLAEAIAAAHPEDARPLMTAALIDLHEGMPASEALDPCAAQDWAKRAGEAELVAMGEAVATEIQGRVLHLDQRKGLLRWLFLSLPFETRLRFMHWGREHVTCE